MNLFRRSVIAVLAAFAVFTAHLPTRGQESVLEGIAALVNDDVVTFSQVRMLVAAKEKAAAGQFQGAALAEKIKEIRLDAVNDLIDRQLILQEFKKMKEKNGASIPEHVIDDRVDTIIREQFGGDRAAFIRTLAAEGYTLDKFRQEQMDSVIVQAMRGQSVKMTNVVPEPKIDEVYHQNLEQYTSEEQVHLRMIVMKQGDDGRKIVDEIRQKVVGGASFQDLARLYSEDSNQQAGGDMGWINRRYLTESLSKVAFSLKPGETSAVLEMSGNYYLLYCEARKAQVTKSLAMVREDIEKTILQTERQKAQQEWIAKLRKKAYIKLL